MITIDYSNNLKVFCREYEIWDFVSHVLEDDRFAVCSGSGEPNHHHYGTGGLAKHTWEVFMYCIDIAERHNACNPDNKINLPELLVSAVWHDYGKIRDYQEVNGVWGKHDNHARQIHHISRSALEFSTYYDGLRAWKQMGENEHFRTCNGDNILHNILSHHGSREYGSPVSPATKEAWVLHLADNLSARLDDCGKYDKIK